MRKVNRRIGRNAAVRAHVVGDLCKRCMFLGDECRDIRVTINKTFGNGFDGRYRFTVTGCSSYIEETLTIDGITQSETGIHFSTD